MGPVSEEPITMTLILDIFEWLDMNANGKIEYNEFETKMGEFLFEESQNNKKKATKKKGKASKKKGGKKSKKKK